MFNIDILDHNVFKCNHFKKQICLNLLHLNCSVSDFSLIFLMIEVSELTMNNLCKEGNMNPRLVTTVIDSEKCIGCGACIDVCPSKTITMVDGTAQVTGEKSLSCGHCSAVCPENAIQVKALDKEMTQFATFHMDSAWMGFGDFPAEELVRLIASRRSCRNFKPVPVEPDVLNDLIKIGALAPSGTNSQEWTFTCLPDRQAVRQFGEFIKRFFAGLNKKAENYLLRKALRLIGMKALDSYYNEYYESIKEAIQEMEKHETDRLFHGAPACILIGTNPAASCPKEDAILAASNIVLAAHAMGLGTCFIGFAVAALDADRSIQGKLGIPGKEIIHAVIALGYPDESYLRITGRKKPTIRFASF